MVMKKLIASGPVIIEDGKLLVTNDGKDDFYKIPGGKVKDGETLEETCLRELEEETGFRCRIIKKLSTMKLDKKPGTDGRMKIELHHYQCELIKPVKNYDSFEYEGHEVRWIEINKLERNQIAPNIKFLFNKGELE